MMARYMTNRLRSPAVTRSRRAVRTMSRLVGTLAAIAGVFAATAIISPHGGRTIEAASLGLGAGGEYHELPPVRVFDTRDPSLDVAPLGRKVFSTNSTTTTFDVPIVGEGGLGAFADGNSDCIDDNVLAVAVNITVVNPTAEGWLRAWGPGGDEGGSSVVNFRANEVVPEHRHPASGVRRQAAHQAPQRRLRRPRPTW